MQPTTEQASNYLLAMEAIRIDSGEKTEASGIVICPICKRGKIVYHKKPSGKIQAVCSTNTCLNLLKA